MIPIIHQGFSGKFRKHSPIYLLHNGLSVTLDEANIKAKFNKGMLHATLPKTEKAKAKSKKIQVKTE